MFLIPVLMLSSCAGYKAGGLKPASLEQVHAIAIPVFKNDSLHPRAEALATSAVANAMVQDGTYRVSSMDSADAILEGTLKSISYSTLRGTRFDSLRPEELNNRVVIHWVLRDAKDSTKVLAKGSSTGRSQLFVSANLQTARNNALPEALDRASEALISRIANSY